LQVENHGFRAGVRRSVGGAVGVRPAAASIVRYAPVRSTEVLQAMEDKMDRLKGKVIIISGGARGQGAAEARLFAGEGARVVIGDVLEPEGRQLASELGPAAAFVWHDVTQATDWETAVNAAEKLGGLHGLVNNAGIYQPRTLMETETELFERHTRVNQLGCFLGMKAVVSLMEQSGGGSIVNISSVAGLRGSPGAIAYSATKWALRG